MNLRSPQSDSTPWTLTVDEFVKWDWSPFQKTKLVLSYCTDFIIWAVYLVNNCPDWLRHIENARNIRPVGTRGAHPQILTDQLTLSRQGGGRFCPPHYYCLPPDFQTLLQPWISWQERNQSVLDHYTVTSDPLCFDDIFPGSLCNCTKLVLSYCTDFITWAVYLVNNCPDWLRHIENARNIRPVGTRGAHPQILTDQLTLSRQGGGRFCPPHYYCLPPDFQTLLQPWISWQERNQSVLDHYTVTSDPLCFDDIFPGSLCNCTSTDFSDSIFGFMYGIF